MLSLIFHAFSVHVIFWECTLLNLKPFSFLDLLRTVVEVLTRHYFLWPRLRVCAHSAAALKVSGYLSSFKNLARA
jgi:hypothetical protein